MPIGKHQTGITLQAEMGDGEQQEIPSIPIGLSIRPGVASEPSSLFLGRKSAGEVVKHTIALKKFDPDFDEDWNSLHFSTTSKGQLSYEIKSQDRNLVTFNLSIHLPSQAGNWTDKVEIKNSAGSVLVEIPVVAMLSSPEK